MNFLKPIASAVSYVTCIPATRIDSAEQLHGLAKYLPSVGLLIGLWLVVLNWLLGFTHTTHIMAGTILAIAWLLLTNGLHFDGLMDTADGIFSHQSRERMLEIMQDPRVGNFGVLAGVAVLLLKVAALSSIPLTSMYFALLFIPAWSRWAETFAISTYPYLKPEGKGKVWHDTTKHPRDLLIGGLAPAALVAAACALGYWQSAVISAFTALSGVVASMWLAKKLQGQTGDTYGCVVELSEAGGLVFSALLLSLQNAP